MKNGVVVYTPQDIHEARPALVRSRFLQSLLVVGFLVIAARLVQVQVMDHEAYTQTRENQISSWATVQPRRGSILDRNDKILATSVAVRSCSLDPMVAMKSEAGLDGVVRKLDELLDLSTGEIETLLTRATRQRESGPVRFVWVRRHLDEAVADAIAAESLPGVVMVPEFTRRHPNNRVGAHVLGFTDIDGRGLEAIEKVCDSFLTGIGSTRAVRVDALRRPMNESSEGLPEDRTGLNVVLSLDATIQTITEQEIFEAAKKHGATSACAVVMDPHTGDILAMVGLPRYHPDEPNKSPVKNRLNPVVASVLEPGSTFKPISYALALEAGVTTETEQIFCENKAWRMPNGRILRDSHGYGYLSSAWVIVKSSNIGIAKIIARLGAARFYQGLRRFGFGEPTGISLPGELGGTLRPVRQWTSYSMGSIPMGQEVTVTPLQLATAYAAIANGGRLLKPRLIHHVVDSEGRTVSDVPVTEMRRVLRPEIAARVRKVLRDVVTDGTGRRIKENPFAPGGKTGTAQLAVNEAEYAAGQRGYSDTRYVGDFVAMAPFDNPRLVVVAVVREPKDSHYGGVVAAPAVGRILARSLRYLRVAPHGYGEGNQ